MSDVTIGYALCGSFCTFRKSIEQMKRLVELGYRVLPVMSQNAYSTDTRFGKAEDFIKEVEEICGNPIIHTIVQAEPIGPKKMMDILVISPCTGNTLAKLSNGITDTSVTMAAKSHLRIGRPVLLAMASNDGLGASAQNIGKLINTKHIFFVPFSQDDCQKKPNSLVAHFDLLPEAVAAALLGDQIQPVVR
ncbi:MAG: dipicolinate synthase subunit B [Clostridiales bacterium]|jgi:dipicolinate synthase subunit B|nr:dipicolinate synthase subunit B [Clostridiales bacterium]